jgi:hypothetical protein
MTTDKPLLLEPLSQIRNTITYYFDTHRGQEITLAGADVLLDRIDAIGLAEREAVWKEVVLAGQAMRDDWHQFGSKAMEQWDAALAKLQASAKEGQ